MQRSWLGLGLALLIVSVVGVWLYFPHLHSSDAQSYHIDEGWWVASGDYYFQKLFVAHDISAATWESNPYGAWSTPAVPVGKYLMGLGVALVGEGGQHTQPPTLYHVSASFEENRAAGAVAAPRPLVAARRVVALLTIATALLVTLLAQWLYGRPWAAGLAGLLFLFDPLSRYAGQRAMVDMPALCFSLLTLVAAVATGKALVALDRQRAIAGAVATGVASGLAFSTKQNALLIAIVVAIWLLLLVRHHPTARRLGRMVGVTTVLAAGLTVYALNPFLYRSPLLNGLRLLYTGSEVASTSVAEPYRLDGVGRRLAALPFIGLLESGALYRTLPTLPWRCLAPRCVPAIPLWERPPPAGSLAHGPWWDALLAAMGLAWLLHTARTGNLAAQWVLAWGAIVAGGVLAWAPFAWHRWFLPLEPLWTLLMVAGVIAMASRRPIRRRVP